MSTKEVQAKTFKFKRGGFVWFWVAWVLCLSCSFATAHTQRLSLQWLFAIAVATGALHLGGVLALLEGKKHDPFILPQEIWAGTIIGACAVIMSIAPA
jgi:CHASE2 domain-containing sensor protein